jgi:hypothetical protein
VKSTPSDQPDPSLPTQREASPHPLVPAEVVPEPVVRLRERLQDSAHRIHTIREDLGLERDTWLAEAAQTARDAEAELVRLRRIVDAHVGHVLNDDGTCWTCAKNISTSTFTAVSND